MCISRALSVQPFRVWVTQIIITSWLQVVYVKICKIKYEAKSSASLALRKYAHVWPDLQKPNIMVHTKIFSIKDYENLVHQVDTLISINQALQILYLKHHVYVTRFAKTRHNGV